MRGMFLSCLFRIVPKQVQGPGRVSPILVYFYECLKIDALAKELLQALAGFGSHFLQCLAAMADDDAFLAVALNVDDGMMWM